MSNCCSTGLCRGRRFFHRKECTGSQGSKNIKFYRDMNIIQCSRVRLPHARQPRAVKESTDVSRKQPRANKYAETMQPFSSSRRGVFDNDIALTLEQGREALCFMPRQTEQSKAQAHIVARTNPRARRTSTPKQRNHPRTLLLVPSNSGNDVALAGLLVRPRIPPWSHLSVGSKMSFPRKIHRRVRRIMIRNDVDVNQMEST